MHEHGGNENLSYIQAGTQRPVRGGNDRGRGKPRPYSWTTQTRQLELAAGVMDALVTLHTRTVTVFAALTNADQESPASTA